MYVNEVLLILLSSFCYTRNVTRILHGEINSEGVKFDGVNLLLFHVILHCFYSYTKKLPNLGCNFIMIYFTVHKELVRNRGHSVPSQRRSESNFQPATSGR